MALRDRLTWVLVTGTFASGREAPATSSNTTLTLGSPGFVFWRPAAFQQRGHLRQLARDMAFEGSVVVSDDSWGGQPGICIRLLFGTHATEVYWNPVQLLRKTANFEACKTDLPYLDQV